MGTRAVVTTGVAATSGFAGMILGGYRRKILAVAVGFVAACMLKRRILTARDIGDIGNCFTGARTHFAARLEGV